MKLSVDDAKLLRSALHRRPRTELKRAFALIRAHDDRVLMAALTPAKKRPPLSLK